MSKPARIRVVIRRAKRTDLPAAQQLERATFTHYAISPRQMRYLQQSRSAIFLIVEISREFAGDAIALVRRNKNGARTGRIYSVVVDEKYRGRGIGQVLMAGLMDELSRQRIERVFLEVETTNQGAIHLYEQLGFRTIKQMPHYYGRTKHGVQMRRDGV